MSGSHATTYGPSAGARFLTRDPIEALTRSAYGYAGNNPINVTDPSGMCPWCVAIGIGILVGGGIDLGFQMFDNAREGCGPLDDINWGSVAFWGAVGGVTGGLGHWIRAARAGAVFRSNTSHIFRNATGHLATDTAANRALLRGAIRPEYLVGTRGPNGAVSVYRRLLPDGTQVWVEVLDGRVITNGGVNLVPRP